MPGPGRPPNEKDILQFISGAPVFLGKLTSTAAAPVNNGTTAIPFNVKSQLANVGFQGSLAGKVLLLQSAAGGLILPNPATGSTPTPIVVQQATAPNPPVAVPGILLGANERVEITMPQNYAYLDFVAVTGNAELLVYEMV